MGLIETFFFDSYALFSIFEGKENYLPYAQDTILITSKLNLMEFHYGVLLKKGKDIADFYYDLLVQYAVAIDDDVFKTANKLRANMKKRSLSYVDCVGYTLARKMNIKFLTGDQQFKDLENVEYVK